MKKIKYIYFIPTNKNEELTSFLQKELFKQGYSWPLVPHKKIKHLDCNFLVIYSDDNKINYSELGNSMGIKYKPRYITIIDLFTNNIKREWQTKE